MVPITQVITKTKEADIMPMDEAISIMLHGDVTPERVQGLMECIRFEDEKPDFEAQVGMTPKEFKQKYSDLLGPNTNMDRQRLIQFVNNAAEKYSMSAKRIADSIELRGQRLSKYMNMEGGDI